MNQYRIEGSTGQHLGNRDEQQDRVALFGAPKAPGYMMAVLADGMGGMKGGALAAEQVIRTARQAFEAFSPQTDDIGKMLRAIITDAHTVIKLTAVTSEKNPHSTAVILVLTPDRRAYWAHVGDSRLYRFSGPNCAEHTRDHSYVAKLVAEGKLSEEAAHSHPLANVLVNILGSHEHEPDATIGSFDGLKAGDAFLLCSDGLWRYFSGMELGVAIAVNTPRQAAEMLIRKARERAVGTDADNCTLGIVKLVAVEAPEKTYSATKMKRAV